MAVEKLGQVILGADEMEASIAFYRDVLGLKLKMRDGARWAAFDCGAVTLALTSAGLPTRPEFRSSANGGALVAFRVTDIREFANLKGAEAGIVEGPHELLVEVRDPGGNIVMLYQPKKPAQAAPVAPRRLLEK